MNMMMTMMMMMCVRRAMYMWSERVVRNVTRKNWSIHTGSTTKVVNMIVTPRVKVSFTLIAEHFRQHIKNYVLFYSMLSYIYISARCHRQHVVVFFLSGDTSLPCTNVQWGGCQR